MKKKILNEVKLDSRIKNALRIINDKLGIQKDFRDSKDLGFEDLEMTGPMMDYIDGLTVDEKKVLIDVIKSITLLTSGNVKSVLEGHLILRQHSLGKKLPRISLVNY